MELRRLRRHVINRGGLSEAWLVYMKENDPDPRGAGSTPPRPRLVRAFWSRGEATEWVRLAQARHKGERYELYHVALDEKWVLDNTLRTAQLVPALETAPRGPDIAVSPGAIAHAFG